MTESSWARHSRRCSTGLKAPSRQKACQHCVAAKIRCNLERPTCRTCYDRRIVCSYNSPDTQPSKHSASPSNPLAGDGQRKEGMPTTPDQDIVSEQLRQDPLNATHSPPKLYPETFHTLQFIVRVLKSWPRMMINPEPALLPPMIHSAQLKHGTPTPLANCSTLVKMWFEHIEGSSRLVYTSISEEVQKLFREV